MKARRVKRLSLLLILLTLSACYIVALADRPSNWAQPVQVDGVPNLHKVSDILYRSAQPTAEGFKKLEAMGFKTIVNLRSYHSDADVFKDTGLIYIQIPMVAWYPEEEDVIRFLRMLDNSAGDLSAPMGSVGTSIQIPVLVHCLHGADRTGIVIATYRIAAQGWTKEEALAEMTDGGFGFHYVWWNLVWWINGLDVEKIRSEAGTKIKVTTY